MVIVMMATGLFLSFAFERYYWFMLALAAVAAATARTSIENQSNEAVGGQSVGTADRTPYSTEASS